MRDRVRRGLRDPRANAGPPKSSLALGSEPVVDAVHVSQETSDGPSSERPWLQAACTSTAPDFATPQQLGKWSPCGDHVVHDGHRFPSDVKILGLVHDGVGVDAGFLKVENSQLI